VQPTLLPLLPEEPVQLSLLAVQLPVRAVLQVSQPEYPVLFRPELVRLVKLFAMQVLAFGSLFLVGNVVG
jgi:hypothetical protein